MNNADSPAMPIELNGFGQYAPEAHCGLTKREMIAMNIMANIAWNATDKNNPQHYERAAVCAVTMADLLLKELNK